MFNTTTISAVRTIAREMKWPESALLAVCEVESAGVAFAVVDGRQEPVIRFEGHYFYKRLSGDVRSLAGREGLASPKAGVVKNPKTQDARWQMLNRAIAIDANAALESCSWGLGQVMGAHWKWLGYASVTAMVNDARSGVAGQVRIMAKFIDKSGLDAALKNQDWAGFAHGYNGPKYRVNQYDVKLRKAYDKWLLALKTLPVDVSKPTVPDLLAQEAVVSQKQPELIDKPVSVSPTTGKPIKPIGLGAGIIVAVVAGFYGLACHLPTSFINWAGFAAKCTGN